ncbi:g594 [Coccomyxa elongata]
MQHASYECDRSRMVDIFNSCGGAPVTFVRYNPDGFKLAGKKSSADTKTRHELLLREVEKGLAGKQERLLSIVKLFLDNDRDDFVQRSWIDVDDHRFTETSSDNQM